MNGEWIAAAVLTLLNILLIYEAFFMRRLDDNLRFLLAVVLAISAYLGYVGTAMVPGGEIIEVVDNTTTKTRIYYVDNPYSYLFLLPMFLSAVTMFVVLLVRLRKVVVILR